MNLRLALSVGAILSAVYPVAAQSTVAFQPAPCASGGFGLPVYTFGTHFQVTQPIRVTHLCHLVISPTDPTTPVVELWTGGAAPTLLASAAIGAQNFGTHCLTGSSNPAVMAGSAIAPIDLMPGDYVVTHSTLHWWFQTLGFQSSPEVTFLNAVYAGFNNYGASFVFGPSFVYEPIGAAVQPLGPGCPGSLGVPLLNATPPYLGQTVATSCSNLPAVTFAWLVLGFSSTNWGGNPLPLDLASFGMPGCAARLSIDATVGGLATGGVFANAFLLPADPAMAGSWFHLQSLVLDLPANAGGAVVSNALRLRIGY